MFSLLFSRYSAVIYCERRRRDLNPRAATNDLLPFQGSPFNHLGTSASTVEFYLIQLLVYRFKSGESGIRTHAPLRTNGFQDRLVMTTSISLQTRSVIIQHCFSFVKYFFLNFFYFFFCSIQCHLKAQSVYHYSPTLSTLFLNFFYFFCIFFRISISCIYSCISTQNIAH